MLGSKSERDSETSGSWSYNRSLRDAGSACRSKKRLDAGRMAECSGLPFPPFATLCRSDSGVVDEGPSQAQAILRPYAAGRSPGPWQAA